ncbi:MAG: ChaN family lipoprotein [Sulfitobacter sp.]
MARFFATTIALCFASVAQADFLELGQAAQMKAADIVILGENHGNAVHHAGQAALMAEVGPTAVVFEMLTPEMAESVMAFEEADLATLGRAIGWETAGWPEFSLYQPIFEALGGAEVVGAAMPRAQVRQAFSEGAASVFGAQAERFGLQAELPAGQHERRMKMQFDAHCEAMPLAMMGGMVEAQRLRDAHFSRVALQALEAYGRPVVVITGNGHARKDWGMPFVLEQVDPSTAVFAVGFVEQAPAAGDARFDAIRVTDPAPRGDPCAAFEKG